MVLELKAVQNAYDGFEQKEMGDGGFKFEAEKDDGLDNCAPSVRYSLRRLICGVFSSREVQSPKKNFKKTNIPVAEIVYGAMAPVDVQKAVEKEFEMALQDRVMEETKDKKNAVEAYVYDMRNKLNDKYQEFVTASEREVFTTKLQEVEDWLYMRRAKMKLKVYILPNLKNSKSKVIQLKSITKNTWRGVQ